MCGISGIISQDLLQEDEGIARDRSALMRHRGPDGTGVAVYANAVLVHERLAIVGISTGAQPFYSEDGMALVANCEIYNYREIVEMIRRRAGGYVPRSDADVILRGYEVFGQDILQHIRGMYAFVIYDDRAKQFFVARDPIGIIPLYYGYDSGGRLMFASEMKSLCRACKKAMCFPPGSFALGSVGGAMEPKRYYLPEWSRSVGMQPADLHRVRDLLVSAVQSHMMADVDVAALLSGGLDSSLVAGIAAGMLRKQGRVLATYSVGLEGSPDLECARTVAEHIGSDHHEVTFTVEEGLRAIRSVIWHLETYDITTVRASIPMYLMGRRVSHDGLKVVMSGEGADEIFGGYLYFHEAPSAEEFHWETARRVMDLSYADCLRANKSMMAWGVECRVPLLDTDFVDYAMAISPSDRMGGTGGRMEKHVLRAAFDGEDVIPDAILWRQKEQFSDGVGYSWIDALQEHGAMSVSDEDLGEAAVRFPVNPPSSKEAFYYRTVYEELFGRSGDETVKKWIPRTDWGCSMDPSGRAQKAHCKNK